jgi:NAD(P)-dependent dehydrogenase (short-subunit alcohol dehydrogenase family)
MDLFSLQGRTALVTGGTRGIGRSLAIALAEAGSNIVLIQRPGSQDSETRTLIEKLGRRATVYHANLASSKDMSGLVKRITDDGHDINILVNCGGIQRRHPAHQFPDEDWNEVWPGTSLYCRRLNENAGAASKSERCFHPLSRRWSLYAFPASTREPSAPRIDY